MKNHFHIKGLALNLVLIQRPVGTRTICGRGGGECVDISEEGGGVVQKRESPDFRSPEVGISALLEK